MSERVRANFAQREVVATDEIAWEASPVSGVDRRKLDRIGGEVGRVTSLVRYAHASVFTPHVHGGGEEFFVLSGTFADEHGEYPAGHYVRNPVGSEHAPRSPDGCIIFVKLHQFVPEDQKRVVIDSNRAAWHPTGAGVEHMPLHQFGDEQVELVRLAPRSQTSHVHYERGAELFVLKGSCRDEHGTYAAHTWVRNPAGFSHRLTSDLGCVLYRKCGHLPKLI